MDAAQKEQKNSNVYLANLVASSDKEGLEGASLEQKNNSIENSKETKRKNTLKTSSLREIFQDQEDAPRQPIVTHLRPDVREFITKMSRDQHISKSRAIEKIILKFINDYAPDHLEK